MSLMSMLGSVLAVQLVDTSTAIARHLACHLAQISWGAVNASMPDKGRPPVIRSCVGPV